MGFYPETMVIVVEVFQTTGHRKHESSWRAVSFASDEHRCYECRYLEGGEAASCDSFDIASIRTPSMNRPSAVLKASFSSMEAWYASGTHLDQEK